MSKEDKNLIAYCGLYCGDCPIYKGKIADLARDLRKELREARFDKTAEALSKNSFFKTFHACSVKKPIVPSASLV